MPRNMNTAFAILVLILFTLQGCISQTNSAGGNGILESGDKNGFDRPDPDVYECFDYDNWNRCFDHWFIRLMCWVTVSIVKHFGQVQLV